MVEITDRQGVDKLTFDGRLKIAGFTSQDVDLVRFTTLTGAHVQVCLPLGWGLASVAAHVRFNDGVDNVVGFQRAPRGGALTNLIPYVDMIHPDGILELRQGKLANYRLDLGHDASQGFALWQGSWSDIYTHAHESFDAALAIFERFPPQDRPSGAVLNSPHAASVDEDGATLDCGEWVLEISHREEYSTPPWPGLQGEHCEFYRLNDDRDERSRILAASRSAVALISRVGSDNQVSDLDLNNIARNLDLDWSDE